MMHKGRISASLEENHRASIRRSLIISEYTKSLTATKTFRQRPSLAHAGYPTSGNSSTLIWGRFGYGGDTLHEGLKDH